MRSRLPTPATDFCSLNSDCWAYFFYNWQTLIGGALAIGAAFIAGYFVRKQITAADRIESARLARRDVAARAVLPLTLDAFTRYAERCAEALQGAEMRVIWDPSEEQTAPPALVAPSLAPQLITDLERMIESMSEERAIRLLSALASHAQALSAYVDDIVRMANGEATTVGEIETDIDNCALRVARVYAIPQCLYRWLRGQEPLPEDLTWARVESARNILDAGGTGTHEKIYLAKEAGIGPLDWGPGQ